MVEGKHFFGEQPVIAAYLLPPDVTRAEDAGESHVALNVKKGGLVMMLESR